MRELGGGELRPLEGRGRELAERAGAYLASAALRASTATTTTPPSGCCAALDLLDGGDPSRPELRGRAGRRADATADVLRRLPPLQAMLGRFDEARRMSERSAALVAEIGGPLQGAFHAFSAAPVHVLAGEFAAERELRASAAIVEAMGDRGFLSTILVEPAESLIAQGRHEEAWETIARAREKTEEFDITTQSGWRAAAAGVLAARGEPEEAERLAREAVAIGTRWYRLGQVLRAAGKEEERASALRRALELNERKGNLVGAAAVRKELPDGR